MADKEDKQLGMTFKFYKKDSKMLEQYGIDLDTIEWWG